MKIKNFPNEYKNKVLEIEKLFRKNSKIPFIFRNPFIGIPLIYIIKPLAIFLPLPFQGVVYAKRNKKNKEKIDDELIITFNDKIIIGEKTVNELVEFLKTKTIIEESPITEISPSEIASMIFNISHSEKYKKLEIAKEELNFVAYKIKESSNNEEFNDTHIIFETETVIFTTNCNKLFLELFIIRGISKFDYDNKTILFSDHLNKLDDYSKLQ